MIKTVRGKRILIVDDSERDRKLIVDTLEFHGFDVSVAASGREALETARETPPDLIISDALMPGMDGFSLCDTWKKDPSLQSIPFLFCSGALTDPRDVELSRRVGADGYVTKPVDIRSLLSQIKDTLAGIASGKVKPRRSTFSGDEVVSEEFEEHIAARYEELIQQLRQEVEERRKNEKALYESEQRFRTVFESSPAAIVVTRLKDDMIQDVNDEFEKIFGHDKSMIIGKTYKEIGIWRNVRDRAAVVEQLKAKNTVYRVECQLLDSKGEIIAGLLSANLVALGNEQHIIFIMEDITERKAAEEELMRSRQTLQDLTTYLQSIREEERRYVAREIHDELGKSLTTLKIDLSALNEELEGTGNEEKLGVMLETIDETMTVARRLSTEMRPSILDDFGLAEAAQWLASDFSDRFRIDCDITIDPGTMSPDAERSTAVFRIMQESLTNVYRHSEAKRVVVALSESEGSIHLEVMDDGKGITDEDTSGVKSFGIIGMKERARALGGELEVTGVPGKGTSVRLTIPT